MIVNGLIYALLVIGGVVVLDALLLLFLWRVRTLNRNLDRREKEREAKRQKTKEDWMWSEEGQKELYRDFRNDRPSSRESATRQFTRNSHGDRRYRNGNRGLPNGTSKFQSR